MKYYDNLDPIKLVEILESNNMYDKEVIDFCKQKLRDLKTCTKDLKKYAEEILKKRTYNYFVKGKHLNNCPIDLKSHFLSATEAIQCFKESKKKYIKYKENTTGELSKIY